jgi:hypothetical protein
MDVGRWPVKGANDRMPSGLIVRVARPVMTPCAEGVVGGIVDDAGAVCRLTDFAHSMPARA